MTFWSEMIKELQIKRQYSCTEIAAILHIDKSIIIQFTDSSEYRPSLEVFKRLAKLYLEASIVTQYRSELPNLIEQEELLGKTKNTIPHWVEIIYDLKHGLAFSYVRIAKRIHVDPSTIQKLATKPNRKARRLIFYRLLILYYKVFYSELRIPHAEKYLQLKQALLENKGLHVVSSQKSASLIL